MDFDTALENFRTTAETVVREHFNRMGYTFAVPIVEIAEKPGKRFVKLWSGEDRVGGSHSTGIHSFVEISTGDIYKPANTKAPAKHVRGNIYTDDHGRSSMSDGGLIKYLR